MRITRARPKSNESSDSSSTDETVHHGYVSSVSSRRKELLSSSGPVVGLHSGNTSTDDLDVQPKLTFNDPDDKSEREAERVADGVMRISDGSGGADTPISERISTSTLGRIFRRPTAQSVRREEVDDISMPERARKESTQPRTTTSPLADPAEQFVPDRPMGDVERQMYERRLARGEHYRDLSRPMSSSERQVMQMQPPRAVGQSVEQLSASSRLRSFLREKEDLRLAPYDDPSGYCTIGYGHLIARDECADTEVPDRFQGAITRRQAETLFRQDVREHADGFKDDLYVKLTQYEFDALVSFAYNAGPAIIEQSGIAEAINTLELARVPEILMEYTHSDRRELPGLVRRRGQEAELFAHGVYP